MARLTRATQKIFAGSATNNGVFGSLQAGSGQLSNDVETIQSLPAYAQGWNAATISSELLPPLEEFQGVQYANSYQQAYIFQEGVPEWDSGTTYYIGSVVKVITSTGFQLYHSLTDDNTGNATSNTSYWQLDFDSSTGYALRNLSNSTAISNCVTQIPQDIILELSGGTLTLKAGSKVYVPNGSGVFNTVTLESDVSYEGETNGEAKFLFLNPSGQLQTMSVEYSFSGTTEPSSFQSGYAQWYDTTNNLVKRTSNSGSSWESGYSLPICIATMGTTSASIASIDQIFNGIGYIGSTVFGLPGLTLLIPNGRNTDGSLNSTIVSLASVTTNTFTSSSSFDGELIFTSNNFTAWPSDDYSYNANTNFVQYQFSNSAAANIGTISLSSGTITSLISKPCFHAVDFYDLKTSVNAGHIGQIGHTTRTDVPEGCAWCDGSEYTQEAFPDVYQMLVDGKISSIDYTTFNNSVSTNGSCGLFALDTTTQKFKVPLLKDVYLKAGQIPSMFVAESLPNITGSFPADSVPASTGAFYAGGALRYISGQEGGVTVMLNASRSSAAYQDGAKVNPDHVVYRAYVVLYSSAVEASEAQAQEFMTALGGKANVDMSNVSQLGKDTAINWQMPDYPEKNVFKNNVIPWNTAFQLPCDCAVYCGGTAGGTSSNSLLFSFSFDGQTFFPVANWYNLYIALYVGNFSKGMYIKATGGIDSQTLAYTPLRGASQ